MGFVAPEDYIVKELDLDTDQRNNIHAVYGDYRTSVEGVFAGGDCRRGQSLVVWAIHEGRGVADATNHTSCKSAPLRCKFNRSIRCLRQFEQFVIQNLNQIQKCN